MKPIYKILAATGIIALLSSFKNSTNLKKVLHPNLKAQQYLKNTYGLPDYNYQLKHCITWNFKNDFPSANIINSATGKPLEKIFINKDFKDRLHAAFKELEKNSLLNQIKTFDGCYNYRNVTGSLELSTHAWAVSCDINAATEKLTQVKTNFTPAFLNIMRNYLYWGGDFKTRKDNMHFALVNG